MSVHLHYVQRMLSMDDITNGYQDHKNAFKACLKADLELYQENETAGFATDGKLLNNLGNTLASHGPVRLYKYQPFSERNLTDCVKGVLHLTRFANLNDVNEGVHIFDKTKVANELSSIDLKKPPSEILESAPPFLSKQVDSVLIAQLQSTLMAMKDSGGLYEVTRYLSDVLEDSFSRKRETQLCGSLSESALSASMWDRYANGYRGFASGYTVESFVVDYSLTRDKACTQSFKALLAPVAYGERLDLSHIASLAEVRDPNNLNATNFETFLLVLSSLQKAKEWEHEREWRVIAHCCSADAKAFYCALQPDSVYLGPKMDADERMRVIETARENRWSVFEIEADSNSVDWSMRATRLKD